jgi:glycosyltransferase involved in cell wall biosynthesis
MNEVAPDRLAAPEPSRRQLRILVVSRLYPSADQPGRGTFVADLVEALVGAGHDVVVASFETVQLRGPDATKGARARAAAMAWAASVAGADALSTPRSWGAGVPVARLPAIRTWGHGAALDEADHVDRHAEALVAFGRGLAARWPIDLIHAQTGVPDGLAADRLASELGIPLLVSEHDSTLARRLATDDGLARLYRGLADRDRLRAVAVVSPPLADRIRAAAGSDLPLQVLPNPVALDAFGGGDPDDRDPDELLWVGMLADHKGTPLLLATVAELRRRRPRWRLRLIGPAEHGDDGRWRELAGALGIADAVTFEQRADRAGVADAMRRASIFVHPSPWETFGVVAAEAIASGMPVAATPSGGVEWIVGRDGRLGEIAASSEPASLADAIEAVEARRATFDPRHMRTSVADRFAPDRVAATATGLYDRLLTARRSTAGAVELAERAATTPGPNLVIGLHPSAIARLATLPIGSLAGTTLVTAPGQLQRSDDPPPRRRFELDAAGPYRQRLADASGLLGRLRRRKLRAARAELEAAETERVLIAAAETVREAGSGRVRVVAVDADDAVAALEALGTGAILTPGSLRWLADRTDRGV